ncbi:MAG: circadian clock KaiB family protein [Promethearchaeota archaeon]
MLRYVFKLYIYENSLKGKQLINIIQNACKDELAGQCSLEVIDIKKNPERLEKDNIIVYPTIIKVSPPPICELVGEINNKEQLINALNL